jgi:hypothetical protein
MPREKLLHPIKAAPEQIESVKNCKWLVIEGHCDWEFGDCVWLREYIDTLHTGEFVIAKVLAVNIGWDGMCGVKGVHPGFSLVSFSEVM